MDKNCIYCALCCTAGTIHGILGANSGWARNIKPDTMVCIHNMCELSSIPGPCEHYADVRCPKPFGQTPYVKLTF